MAARIFFRTGQGIRRDYAESLLSLIPVLQRPFVDVAGLGLEFYGAWQNPLGRFQASVHGVDHRIQNLVGVCIHLCLALAGNAHFVRHDDLSDGERVPVSVLLQLLHGGVRILGLAFLRRFISLPFDEAAADGVVF